MREVIERAQVSQRKCNFVLTLHTMGFDQEVAIKWYQSMHIHFR
jgi:hypothetical protein